MNIIHLLTSFYDKLFNNQTPISVDKTHEKTDQELLDFMNNLQTHLNTIKQYESELGKPDIVEKENIGDGFISITKIWKKEYGDIKLTSIEPENLNKDQEVENNDLFDGETIDELTKKLKKAIASEDYLKAAKIRDLINKKNKI